jgi:hypothetical protein
MPEKTDPYQHYKGLLGQEIAKLHLEKVKKYNIIEEEVAVDGFDSRARIDILIQRDDGTYSPVEVKFQDFDWDDFGEAFTCVIERLYKKQTVKCITSKGTFEIHRPILYMWRPPEDKLIKTYCQFFSEIQSEIITFETVFKDFHDKEELINEICYRVTTKIGKFFEESFKRGQFDLKDEKIKERYERFKNCTQKKQ